eukprot:687549-Pleurochrysis_carterae.AAC.3
MLARQATCSSACRASDVRPKLSASTPSRCQASASSGEIWSAARSSVAAACESPRASSRRERFFRARHFSCNDGWSDKDGRRASLCATCTANSREQSGAVLLLCLCLACSLLWIAYRTLLHSKLRIAHRWE